MVSWLPHANEAQADGSRGGIIQLFILMSLSSSCGSDGLGGMEHFPQCLQMAVPGGPRRRASLPDRRHPLTPFRMLWRDLRPGSSRMCRRMLCNQERAPFTRTVWQECRGMIHVKVSIRCSTMPCTQQVYCLIYCKSPGPKLDLGKYWGMCGKRDDTQNPRSLELTPCRHIDLSYP